MAERLAQELDYLGEVRDALDRHQRCIEADDGTAAADDAAFASEARLVDAMRAWIKFVDYAGSAQ